MSSGKFLCVRGYETIEPTTSFGQVRVLDIEQSTPGRAPECLLPASNRDPYIMNFTFSNQIEKSGIFLFSEDNNQWSPKQTPGEYEIPGNGME